MANKTIAIIDIDSFENQNIETLLFASILEKKINKLAVLDLNDVRNCDLIFNYFDKIKNKESLTTYLFSNTTYNICSPSVLDQNKLLNMAKSLKTNNDILIFNANCQDKQINSPFFMLSNEIVIFADLSKDVNKNIINFLLLYDLKGKHIHIFAYNFKRNVQTEKTYLCLKKQFNSKDFSINNIDKIPNMKSIKEIENIHPWLEIYKKINTTF